MRQCNIRWNNLHRRALKYVPVNRLFDPAWQDRLEELGGLVKQLTSELEFAVNWQRKAQLPRFIAKVKQLVEQCTEDGLPLKGSFYRKRGQSIQIPVNKEVLAVFLGLKNAFVLKCGNCLNRLK